MQNNELNDPQVIGDDIQIDDDDRLLTELVGPPALHFSTPSDSIQSHLHLRETSSDIVLARKLRFSPHW